MASIDEYPGCFTKEFNKTEVDRYLAGLFRSLSRNGSFMEYSDFEHLLKEKWGHLSAGFDITHDSMSQYLEESHEAYQSWDMLKMLIEAHLHLKLKWLTGYDISNKRALASWVIGCLSIHMIIFINQDKFLPTQKSYWGATDILINFKGLGVKFLLDYIENYILLGEVKNCFIEFLKEEGGGKLNEGASKFTSLIHNDLLNVQGSELRRLQEDIKKARESLGELIWKSVKERWPKQEEPSPEGILDVVNDDLGDEPIGNTPVDKMITSLDLATSQGGFPISREDQPAGQRTYLLEDVPGPFVEPHLELTDYLTGTAEKILLEQVMQPGSRYLLTAPPFGGKTRIQREIALRGKDRGILHLFVDLYDFVHSGISDIYNFTARMLRLLWEVPPNYLPEIKNKLEIFDQSAQIVWHLDEWDKVEERLRSDLATYITPLTWFLLSTSDPHSAKQALQPVTSTHRDMMVLHGEISIMPFDEDQIGEYISQFSELYQESGYNAKAIQLLTEQLPGMASLPGGLEYLAQQSLLSIPLIDILSGFVTDQNALESTEQITQPIAHKLNKILGDIPQDISTEHRYWDLEPKEVLFQTHIQDHNKAEKLIAEWFSTSVRGKIIYPLPNGCYRFVIPEIGYWLVAKRVCKRIWSYTLEHADRVYRMCPNELFSRIWLSYAAWEVERESQKEIQKNRR